MNQDTQTDGVKIFYKIENGKAYSALWFFDHDTACAGSYTMRKSSDGSIITEPEADSDNMQFLSIADAPAQFYVISAEDVSNNNQLLYNFVYKQDENNFYLLADAVDTNKGSLWADWIAASADATSFAAAPTTFTSGTGGGVGGADTFVVHLTRLP